MGKYLVKRILHSIVSIIIVVGIVMVLIYSLMDRQLIFAQDPTYTNLGNNAKVAYTYRRWEEFGYIDYVPYAEWLQEKVNNGEMTAEERDNVVSFARKEDKDSDEVAESVKAFKEYFESKGYQIIRLNAIMSGRKVANGGSQQLFAYKDKPLAGRLWGYLTGLISVDNIHYVKGDVGERKLTFTLHDPVYGGNKFSPAIMGNGTQHTYQASEQR